MDEFDFLLDLRFILFELQLYSHCLSALFKPHIILDYFEMKVVIAQQLDLAMEAKNRLQQQLLATRQQELVTDKFNFIQVPIFDHRSRN